MNTELLSEMRAAVANKTAQVLTLEKAKELKGKKIRTIYFGYRGQDGVDEFVVGEIISHLSWAERNADFDAKWKSQGDYWKSYMTKKQLDEHNTNMLLLREDGTSTSCCCHTKYYNCFNELTFTCSDADREVYYVVVHEITCKKCGHVHEKVSNEINNPFGEYFDNCRFCIDAEDIEAINDNYRDHKAEINKINQSYGK